MAHALAGIPPARSTAKEAVPAKEATTPTTAGAGRVISVVPEPFAVSAGQIVEAAVNNARNIGFAPEGGALLAINTDSDRLAAARAEALREALRSSGVTTIKEVLFARDIGVVKSKLVELIKANPKIGMVLSNDHVGLTASFQAMNDLGEERPYVIAGYTSDESSATMTRSGEFAGAAVYSAERLLRKAITTAVSAARGEKLPDRVELMVPVNLSPKKSGAPRMYKMMASPGAPGGQPKEPSKKQ
jgi:hypothetical protein